jgi:hypothetical protein
MLPLHDSVDASIVLRVGCIFPRRRGNLVDEIAYLVYSANTCHVEHMGNHGCLLHRPGRGHWHNNVDIVISSTSGQHLCSCSTILQCHGDATLRSIVQSHLPKDRLTHAFTAGMIYIREKRHVESVNADQAGNKPTKRGETQTNYKKN